MSIINTKVKRAIILGSGVNCLENKTALESIPYSDITNWPLGKVKGHKGVLDIYDDIWVLRGRAHVYEGFTWQEAKFPTQFLADHGIEELIITNAAGGINPEFEIGDLMQITGYLNFIQPGRSRGGLEALTEKVISFKTDLIDCESYKTDSGASSTRLASSEQAELTGASMMTAKNERNAVDEALRGGSNIKLIVWERGCGFTQACGTGACATVVAAILKGHCKKDEDITVKLPGGDLIIRWDSVAETIFMTGKAEMSFLGYYNA